MKPAPNQPSEPTPPSVTDRAAHAPRQPASWLTCNVRQMKRIGSDQAAMRAILVAGTTLFSGCASTVSPAVSDSLGGNSRLPADEIEALVVRSQWAMLRDLRYDGYVILQAQVQSGFSIRVEKVRESYPDHSRDQLAVSLTKDVRLRASSTGSRIDPQAAVYVLFYEKMPQGNAAVIFAKEEPSSFRRVGTADKNAVPWPEDAVYLATKTY